MKQSPNNIKSSYQNKWANVTISKEVKDYSNHPFFIKKAQEAKEFLEKNGLPEELLKIRDTQYGK